MNRYILAFSILLASTLMLSAPALAAHQLSGVGDIIVDVQDELGNTVTGATVVLQLPSNTPGFTALDDGWDITLTKIDGGTDDDSVAADGDVEFDSNAIATNFNSQVWNGAAFRVTISVTGYVDYVINDIFNDSAVNAETSANDFTLKIVMKKQAPLSTALSGGTVNVYKSDTVTLMATVADGGVGDGDSTNDGFIYIAQDPAVMGAGPHYVTGEKNGFIMKTNNTGTINDGSQTTYTFSLDYPFAITAQDELGNAVTLTTSADVVGSGTLTGVEQDASGGTLYWAATGGPGSITITEPGYITQVSTLATYTYSAVGAQQSLAFQAAGDGPALPFGFMVTAAREVDAMALSLGAASSTFSAGAGVTVVDEQFSGGSGYVAAYGSGNMNLTVDGYIATATAIAFASAGQQVLAYSDIKFALKVVAYDELGYDCVGCSVTHGAVTQDLAVSNTYYLASTSTAALSVASAGIYVTTDSSVPVASPNSMLASIAVDSTTQTIITFGASGAAGETPCSGAHSAGAAATCTGLLYPMKLVVYDELGYTNNMATVTATFGVAGVADEHPAGTNKYYWRGTIAADALTVSQDGYVDMDNTQDAALGTISADDTGQTLITMTGQTANGAAIAAGDNATVMGMLYGFKITAQDELGNTLSLNSTDATLTPGGNFAMTSLYYSGGEAYVAATDTAPDTFSLAYTGYINTTTLGNWTYNAAGQQTINFDASGTPDGDQLKYRVRVMVSDELGNPINEAELTGNAFTVSGVSPAAISTASNSLYFPVETTGPFVGLQTGYVHSPLAADLALSSVVPGTVSQTVVMLTGTTACGGGSIPDGTTVSCSGLQYNIKAATATTELGALLTMDAAGAEAFALYTDSGCSSPAAYATGPFLSGGAYYAGVASGSTYYGYFSEPGYAASCDTTALTPTGAAQLSPVFDGADSLKYNIKLSSVYSETGTLISTIDGAVGEQLDLYFDAACSVPAAAASGPFYYSGAWYAAIDPGTYYAEFTETGYLDDQCDADATSPDGTSQASPSFNGGDGMVYNIKTSVAYTELGSLIPVDGDETVAVFTDAACSTPATLASGPIYVSGAWYVAAASNTNYYAYFGEPGYVSDCDSAFITPTGLSQLSPTFSGGDALMYNIKLTSATNELGALLTIDNNEDVGIFTDAACSSAAAVASGPFYNSGAWYAAAASGTPYYMSLEEYGYVDMCDATSITPDGLSQISPSFAGADAPMYNIKLTAAATELSAPITIDGDESLALYTDSACTAAAAGVATGPFYFSGAWYAAPASGTAYYAKLSEPGYVASCDATTVTPTGAAQMSPSITGAADGLKYSIKLSNVYSETGTLLSTIDGAVGEQLDIYTDAACAVPAAVASGPFYFGGAWYASIAAGTYYAEFTETGYVDDQCDADSISPAGTAQLSPSFNGGDGMVYNVKVDSIFTELAAPLTVNGDETINIYTDAPCAVGASLASGPIYFSGAWYAAAASGTNYYVEAGDTGYISNCDATPINPTGAAAVSPSLTGADGLLYNIKLTTAFTELDAPLTIDNTEGMALYTDSGCSSAAAVASGPFYFTGAWYAAATAATPYYAMFAEQGYVDSCDSTSVTPDGVTQMSPSFSGAADGLKYNIKLSAANTELGAALTIDNTESVALFTDAACSAAAAVASGPFYFSGSWYAAAASGTAYYGQLSESGYVTGCDATSITPTGAAQMSPSFDGAPDGLKYNIKLSTVYSETGTMLTTIDGAAGEQLDIYTDAACSVPAAPASGPFYYGGAWYAAIASGTAYYAEFTETGFVDDQCDADATTPDGITQMSPLFSGAADGMVYNIKISAADSELGAPLTIDDNESVSVFTDAACSSAAALATGPLYFSGAWYIGAASGTGYYVSLEDYGYVASCDDAAVSPTGAAQLSPVFSGAADGLKYNIKLSSAYTELDAPLTIDNTEGMAIYTDAGCSAAAAVASGPFYYGGAWYAAAASGTVYYSALSESGYVTSCDSTSVTPTGAAQMSPDFAGAADGLKYNIKLSSVSTELSIPITTIDGAAGEQLDIYSDSGCTIPAAAASGPFYYGGAWYAAVASGTAVYGEFTEAGFVDDQCDADATTPDGLTQFSPSFSGADGLIYNIALTSAESELSGALAIDGDETFALYSDAACTAGATVATGPVYFGGSWYAAAASGTAYYGGLTEPGYLTGCDLTSITPTGAAQISPDFSGADGDGLIYSVKFTTAYSELGAQLTVDGTSYESLEIFNDSACGSAATVASGPFYFGSAWYAAVEPGLYYSRFTEPGFTTACDDASINPSTTAQVSPVIGDSTDIMKYTVKVTTISEELGNALPLEASDSVAFYSGAGCAGAVAAATGPIFDVTSSAWYAGMDPGTYYASYSKTGYVDACDTVQVAVATSTQVTPGFVSAALDYSLVVKTNDQYGFPVTGVTMTHGGVSPAWADLGTYANMYYFNATGTAGIGIVKDGFVTIDESSNSVEPGGGAVGQTFIELTGTTNGDLAVVSATVPGTSVLRNGIVHDNNVELTVEYASSTPIGLSGLGNFSNFYFVAGDGSRVTPDNFYEVDRANRPGVYHFKVATDTVSVQVKSVDYDSDPQVDFVDSDPLVLTGLNASLQLYGPIIMYPAADYITITPATSTIEAGATQAFTVSVYDNDGMLISTGPHSMLDVSVSLTGGSVSPASTKDIFSTTLTGASSVAGAADTTVTGSLSGGTANVVITDSVVTDGLPVVIAATPVTWSLTQYYKTSTTASMEVVPASLVGEKITIIDPTDATIDDMVKVRIEIQDASGNLVPTVGALFSFNVAVSGSAVFSGIATGTISAGSGTAAATVQPSAGVVEIYVSDSVVETVNLTVNDPSAMTPLDDTSTQNLSFATGAAASVVFFGTTPSSQTVGGNISIECRVYDSGGNHVTNSNAVFTVKAAGATSASTPTFGTPSKGAAISGVGTNSIAVRAASGTAVIPITDAVAQTVGLSLSDSDSTGLTMTSSSNVTFTSGALFALNITTSPMGLTAGTKSSAYTIQLQDSNGNSVDAASDVVVSLSVAEAAHSTTGKFYDSTSTATGSITISTGNSSGMFYYMDTLAGAVTLRATSSGVQTDTVAETIVHANPINATSVTVSTATKETDTEQPTTLKSRQYYPGTLSTITMVEYPYTDNTDYFISANSNKAGVIRVYLKDQYGNAISGETLSLTVSGVTGYDVSPSNIVTDANGYAEAFISSPINGTAVVSIDMSSYGYDYGKTFTIYFKEEDHTPPQSTRYGTETLVDGDYMDPYGNIHLKLYLDDLGTNAVGVDTSTIELTVTDPSSFEVTGDTTSSCQDLGSSASPRYLCSLEWTWDANAGLSGSSRSKLADGYYTVSLSVMDLNSNELNQSWTLQVLTTTELKEVMSGPGMFDPRSGEPMKIAFQVPEDNSYLTLEIYDRRGKLVFITSDYKDAGYGELTWDGITPDGGFAGNGVYMYRLTCSVNGTKTSQTGKLAVFKQ